MSKTPNLIISGGFRGSPEYEQFVEDLWTAAKDAGNDVPGICKLVELALAHYGASLGLVAPQRMAPHGTNRYGQPKAKEKA